MKLTQFNCKFMINSDCKEKLKEEIELLFEKYSSNNIEYKIQNETEITLKESEPELYVGVNLNNDTDIFSINYSGINISPIFENEDADRMIKIKKTYFMEELFFKKMAIRDKTEVILLDTEEKILKYKDLLIKHANRFYEFDVFNFSFYVLYYFTNRSNLKLKERFDNYYFKSDYELDDFEKFISEFSINLFRNIVKKVNSIKYKKEINKELKTMIRFINHIYPILDKKTVDKIIEIARDYKPKKFINEINITTGLNKLCARTNNKRLSKLILTLRGNYEVFNKIIDKNLYLSINDKKEDAFKKFSYDDLLKLGDSNRDFIFKFLLLSDDVKNKKEDIIEIIDEYYKNTKKASIFSIDDKNTKNEKILGLQGSILTGRFISNSIKPDLIKYVIKKELELLINDSIALYKNVPKILVLEKYTIEGRFTTNVNIYNIILNEFSDNKYLRKIVMEETL